MADRLQVKSGSRKRNLVVSPVGDSSYHRQWIAGEERDFDLFLIYYDKENDRYKEDVDYYVSIQGLFKLESIATGLRMMGDIIKQYDAVCLPDDDLIMSACTINRLFEYFYKYDLDLAQPAIIGGFVTNKVTRRDDCCILRYTDFIEMTCPVFRTDILLDMLDIFTLNRSGWGVDLLWSKILREKGMKLAVIDDVGIYHGIRSHFAHTIRHDREYYNRLSMLGIDPFAEVDRLVKEYDCPRMQTVRKKIKKSIFARFFLWPGKMVIEFINLIIKVNEKGLKRSVESVYGRMSRIIAPLF